jgi:hypothetical protein
MAKPFMLNAQGSNPELQTALAGLKASSDVRTDSASHTVYLSIRLEKQ